MLARSSRGRTRVSPARSALAIRYRNCGGRFRPGAILRRKTPTYGN